MKKRNWYWKIDPELTLFKNTKIVPIAEIDNLQIDDLKVILLAIAKLYAKIRDGNICVSCGAKNLVGKNWQGGHFIRSSTGGVELRYLEENIHSQCYRCNICLSGNEGEYYRYMLSRYGKRKVDKLFHLKHIKGKWYKPDFLKKIKKYIKLLKSNEQSGAKKTRC